MLNIICNNTEKDWWGIILGLEFHELEHLADGYCISQKITAVPGTRVSAPVLLILTPDYVARGWSPEQIEARVRAIADATYPDEDIVVPFVLDTAVRERLRDEYVVNVDADKIWGGGHAPAGWNTMKRLQLCAGATEEDIIQRLEGKETIDLRDGPEPNGF